MELMHTASFLLRVFFSRGSCHFSIIYIFVLSRSLSLFLCAISFFVVAVVSSCFQVKLPISVTNFVVILSSLCVTPPNTGGFILSICWFFSACLTFGILSFFESHFQHGTFFFLSLSFVCMVIIMYPWTVPAYSKYLHRNRDSVLFSLYLFMQCVCMVLFLHTLSLSPSHSHSVLYISVLCIHMNIITLCVIADRKLYCLLSWCLLCRANNKKLCVWLV